MPSPPGPPPPRKWTDADRDKVRGLLAQGATGRTVAAVMHISRNAAIGRIHRDPDLKQLKITRAKHKPTAKSKLAIRWRLPARVSPPGDVVSSQPPQPTTPSVQHPMLLLETGNRCCKWPVTMDRGVLGGLWCCGAAIPPGDVYCAEHREKSIWVRR